MLKTLLSLLLLASLSIVAADAKTMKVPDESPVASVTFPDSWEPDAIENGVVAASPDAAVYMSLVAVDSEKGMDAAIDDTFEMLKEHKVELDESSKKENKFKINGFDAKELLFQGKDEDGPAGVSITFVTVKDKVIVLTYWVTASEESKHSDEISKILKSLKAA